MRVAFAWEPGRSSADRGAGAIGCFIVLRITSAAAVVYSTYDYRPVDIAFQKVDQDFGTNAWYRNCAPVFSSNCRH